MPHLKILRIRRVFRTRDGRRKPAGIADWAGLGPLFPRRRLECPQATPRVVRGCRQPVPGHAEACAGTRLVPNAPVVASRLQPPSGRSQTWPARSTTARLAVVYRVPRSHRVLTRLPLRRRPDPPTSIPQCTRLPSVAVLSLRRLPCRVPSRLAPHDTHHPGHEGTTKRARVSGRRRRC